MRKPLSELLSSFTSHGVAYSITGTLKDAEVSSLAFDSRAVTQGALFFALPGTHTSGNTFVEQAIERGASAVIYQGEIPANVLSRHGERVAFVQVASSRFAMSPVSAAFYDNPSEKLVVFGVTGTEGKSSTVSFIWQLLRKAGYKAGFISTVQYSTGDDAIDNSEHQTTPEAPIVQMRLHQMVQNGCTHAVIEASSHGLSRRTNRLGDVLFDCAVLMNVKTEHLEFHGDFDTYKNDKANLFRSLDAHDHTKTIAGKRQQVAACGIVNLEDKEASFFASSTHHKVVGFTSAGRAAPSSKPLPPIPSGVEEYCCRAIVSDAGGISFILQKTGQEGLPVCALVPGTFNVLNVTASLLAVAMMTGVSLADLIPFARNLVGVKGRMTSIDEGQDFEVIVDYAHTPSSFEAIFPAIRVRCKERMICVFGSAGERDTVKRPLQGEVAGHWCDVVILADEDPRGEDSEAILRQIAAGATQAGKVEGKDLFLIACRPAAIRRAFALAGAGDVVMLLGKSHENSIIYADGSHPYDEITEARKALRELLAAQKE